MPPEVVGSGLSTHAPAFASYRFPAAVMVSIQPASTELRAHNTSQRPPTSFPFSFRISPDTDLWLKPVPIGAPPSASPHIANNQPTIYASLPLSSFVRATATISVAPTALYDQTGLVVLYPHDQRRWIKGGIEYVDGLPKRSVVVASGPGASADWSVSPPVSGISDADDSGRVRTIVEFEREETGTGASLLVKIDGEAVREITWVFAASQNPEEEIWVGFYGARPAKPEGRGDLEVLVESWDLVVKNIR
ncbi:hypothetical protein H0H92_008380 [Tricholoma furcatifolium]|nr:hypothetical protein H0H92_008380 [Tricholoma furcatifolium]